MPWFEIAPYQFFYIQQLTRSPWYKDHQDNEMGVKSTKRSKMWMKDETKDEMVDCGSAKT